MPVQQRPQRTPRSIILGIAGIVVGVILVLVLFVVAIPSLTESGKVEVRLGSDTYDAGTAADRARNIAQDGPLLFSDVSSGNRDIWLQHLGDDVDAGWSAFDARLAGKGRECTLVWRSASQDFRDPCDGTIVPADGSGLLSYEVTVTDKGKVVVDLTPDPSGPNQ